ncbi:hypothetical protein D3C80_1459890 [compost metagenome]
MRFVEQGFADCLAAVKRVHLIGFTIAIQRRARGFTERAVEGGGEFGGVGHDGGVGETRSVQRLTDGLNLTIHRCGWRDKISPSSRRHDGLFAQVQQRCIVIDAVIA